MKKLIHPDIKPAVGYSFIDPDTHFSYNLKYKDFEELEDHVVRYRSQNNLPRIENFRMVWESYICENNTLMYGKCCEVDEKIQRNFEQYWSGAKAFIRSVIKGKESFVDRETAEERASICKNCSMNVRNIGHSQGQFYTNKFIQKQVGNRTTSKDKDLYTCKICTCILKGKVHYAPSIVAESLSNAEIGKMMREPRHKKTGQKIKCWQLSEYLKEGESDE